MTDSEDEPSVWKGEGKPEAPKHLWHEEDLVFGGQASR